MSDSPRTEIAVLSNEFEDSFEDEFVERMQFSLTVSSDSESSNSPPESWSFKRSGNRPGTSSHSDGTPGSPFKLRATAQKIKKNLQYKYEEVLTAGGGVLAEIENNLLKQRRLSTPENIGTKPNSKRKKRLKRRRTEPGNKTPKYNVSADAENDKRILICKDLKNRFEESQEDSLSLDASGSEFHSSQEIE